MLVRSYVPKLRPLRIDQSVSLVYRESRGESNDVGAVGARRGRGEPTCLLCSWARDVAGDVGPSISVGLKVVGEVVAGGNSAETSIQGQHD
jgi:hypothetical protein